VGDYFVAIGNPFGIGKTAIFINPRMRNHARIVMDMIAQRDKIAFSFQRLPAWERLGNYGGLLESVRKVSLTGQSSHHDFDHGKTDECDGGSGEAFDITREAAMTADPSQCALDDPAFCLDDETLIGFVPGDDLDTPGAGTARRSSDTLAAIACITEDDLDEWKSGPRALGQDMSGAVAILDIGGMHGDGEQKAHVVRQDMALDTLGLLARIVADRIDRSPPFGIERTDWLSTIAAVGLASRPSFSRNAM